MKMKDIFIVESKADIEKFKNWISANTSQKFINDDDKEMFVNSLVKNFIFLKSRIKPPYSDFYYWMKNSTPDELKKYVDELLKQHREKTALKDKEKEGAELIYSDDTWKVYHITNYEASAKYGKGTKWCITGTKRWNDGENGKETFQEYHEKNHVEFYFFIKNGTEKYALALYPDGKSYEIFNAEDVSIAYIPDAPQVKGLPDVSEKDDKRILINAIASDNLDDGIILGAIEELATGGYDEDPGDYDIIFAMNSESVASIMKDFIPDDYLEYTAVANGKMTPEEYHEITGDTITDGDIVSGYYWGGDLPEVVVDEDKFTTKAQACDPKNYQGHKYWYFFEDRTSWNPYELYYADDKVGLYNTLRQLLGFDDMYSFLEAVADTILMEVKNGRLDKDALKDIVSDEYLDSLDEDFDDIDKNFTITKKVSKRDLKEALTQEQEEFFKDSKIRNKSGALIPMWHGTDVEFSEFTSPINWFANSKDYARQYAEWLGNTPVYYEAYLNCKNPFNCGDTSARVFDMIPNKLSRESLALCRRLGIDDDDFKRLLKQTSASDEADEYKLKLHTITRLTDFAELVKAKGYDSIITIEDGHHCVGVFNPEDIKRVDNLKPTSSKNINEERKAITWGDLDYAKKTDTRGIMMNGRGTGHFGTGFYFVGKDGPYGVDADGKIKGYDYEPSRPIYEIDLDAYNLFKPRDNDSAYKIHDAMREINNCYEPSLDAWLDKNFDVDKLEDELYQIGWDADTFTEDLDDDLDDLDMNLDLDDLDDLSDEEKLTDEELDRLYDERYRKGVKEFIKKYGLERYVWKDIDTEKLGVIERHLKDAIYRKYDSIQGLKLALKILSRELNVDKNKLLDLIKKAYANTSSKDTISTQIFKALGYDGVDVTHLNHDAQGLSGLDNFSYGTVIYDLKPGTFKRIMEPRKDASGHYKASESLDLKEYFEEIPDKGESWGDRYETLSECPLIATDEVYRIKNMLEKGNAPYRILKLKDCYLMQDARGNKTHYDMWMKAFDDGYTTDNDWDEDAYMVFIPTDFNGNLRWHTRLGSDSYFNCKVYDFGVIFVRDTDAYLNSLFEALGDPLKEISYYKEDGVVEVYNFADGTFTKLDVELDLDYTPDKAITYDIDMKSRKSKRKSKLPEMVNLNIYRDLGYTYEEWKDLNTDDAFKAIKIALENYYETEPINFDWGNSSTTVIVRDIKWAQQESLNAKKSDTVNEGYKSDKFEFETAGYIMKDGSFYYVDEYHGEERNDELEGLPEFSNTHPEEDTCVRIYDEPNEIQYKKLEEIIDKYLAVEGYCKIETWKPNGYDFYEVYSLYENACQDISWDEKIGNWTGYKLVQVIKNHIKNRKPITEMKGKGTIEDEKIWQYFNDCVAEMSKLHFWDADFVLTYDDIDLEIGDALHTFGTFKWPADDEGRGKIILNKYMFEEPEEIVKNTIYHELCHYVVYKWGLQKGVYYSVGPNRWKQNIRDFYKTDWTSHGNVWKRVADKVGSATGQKISRTDSYKNHTGVGAEAQNKEKYRFRCTGCGSEFGYTKKTKFVDTYLEMEKWSNKPRWFCKRCGAGTHAGDKPPFEMIKGK